MPSLQPLPASVNLNPAVTRVTIVPLATSLTTIPAVNAEEVEDVKGWMAKDRAYEGLFRGMKTRMGAEVREMLGPRNVPWWEKGTLDTNASRFLKGREGFDVRYPYRKKEREGGRRKGARREGIRLPRKIDPEDANRPEQLVPIRLEFDVEHHKMRDTFVWNLNDPVISPEHFAQTVVEDYNLAPTYHAVITKTIQDQLSDYRAHSANYDGDSWDLAVTEDTVHAGKLEGKSAAWWGAWRKRLGTEYGFVRAGRGKGHKRRKVVKEEDDDMDAADERPMSVEEFTFDQKALHDDMRILIRLDIIVGSMKLDDQFEWDLDNVDASPEGFAEIYTKELGLGGEFRTAIAHAIREQVQTYQKSLFLVGHPTDGTPVQDEELRNSLLPGLSAGARAMDQVQAFTPLLNYLSDGELERHEKERDKDFNRRRKRNRGGRRGVALPDRDPIRTYRTPAIGFPELDAATLAAAAAATAPMSRRAAAAAASLTIANMVASENGGPTFTPSSLPAVPMPPPLVIKEKTIKGFFKPPPYDTTVLRPRARIPAPITSTAADVSKFPAPLENDPPPPPTSNVVPPDSRAGKIVVAKRAKELERETKEKEFADGQRRNVINGVWHCSNCGCPESIAVGRRKGPLGDKSQCGTCGKYWHRHRRPRPVEYNSDLEYHAGLKREAEIAKTLAKRRGGAAALRAQSGTVPATPADTSEPQTPRDSGEGPSRQSPARDLSPVSDTSSASEPPLAQKVKINGTNHARSPAPPPPPPPEPVNLPPPLASPLPPPPPPSGPVSFVAPPPTPPAVPSPVQPSASTSGPSAPISGSGPAPPQWLSNAMHAMQAKWKNDKFEVILRKVNSASSPEWRIKCLDCPGKLYQPGPEETLSNYEVHLKNRLHRQRVNDRMGNSSNS
ncbi:SNF5-domain-containing protein [Mycena vulgaris]|nr:SNF5-domain-containing protein [Mycena vulgaris]